MSSTSTSDPRSDDALYDAFRTQFTARFAHNVGDGTTLFTTDAAGLFDAYLAAMPEAHRRTLACAACRQFVERFGALVSIDEDGRTTPAFWDADDAPGYYRPAVEAVAQRVRRAAVTGVFLSAETTWGRPATPLSAKWQRAWTHLAVTPPPAMVYARPVLTAGQAMAAKREDYLTVDRALAEFSPQLVRQAVTILRAETLYRAEHVIGPAEWLAGVHAARARVAGSARDHVLWRAVATAPAGFCHPRASMVGTLLEDLAAGLPVAEVTRRFAARMHPLQYQRPQAAPTAGAIAQAEKLVAELNAAGALARRFARVDELEAIWRARSDEAKQSNQGVFGHLVPRAASPTRALELPPATMTWVKFRETVLPSAEAIEFQVRTVRDPYATLVTAANPDAPPILQWDRADRRNPVSWYFWHGGSTPESFGLRANTWVTVTAVTLKPSSWGDRPLAHQGEFALFVLDGARDTRTGGAMLFPEFLRSEFHGVRAVLEAYSQRAELEGLEQASACGIALQKGSAWNQRFRVTTSDGAREYVLDRWD